MTIERTAGGGIMITGAKDIELYRILALKSRLKLEVNTGMNYSNRGPSTLQLVKQATGLEAKTKKAMLPKFEAWIDENYPKPNQEV